MLNYVNDINLRALVALSWQMTVFSKVEFTNMNTLQSHNQAKYTWEWVEGGVSGFTLSPTTGLPAVEHTIFIKNLGEFFFCIISFPKR